MMDEYMFWQFVEFFIQFNNTLFVEYDPNAKWKNLLDLRKATESSLTKFKESLLKSKTLFEESMIKSIVNITTKERSVAWRTSCSW